MYVYSDSRRALDGAGLKVGRWLKRRLDAGQLEAGEWRTSPQDIGGDRRVELGCPGCAYVSVVDRPIAPNGVVVGVWPCPSEACPYSEYLALDGWDE